MYIVSSKKINTGSADLCHILVAICSLSIEEALGPIPSTHLSFTLKVENWDINYRSSSEWEGLKDTGVWFYKRVTNP